MNPDDEFFKYEKTLFSYPIWLCKNIKRKVCGQKLLPKSKIGKKVLKLQGLDKLYTYNKGEISLLKEFVEELDRLNKKSRYNQFTAKFGTPTGHIKKS